MKNLIIASAILVASCSANSQAVKESAVPKPVVTSFQTNFAGAKAEKWEKEKDGNYEAEFDWKKIESSATFSADGKLLETEQEISTKELPALVGNYVTKNYAGYKIAEAAKITADGKVMYEAEVKKGKEGFDLIFDSAGNFIKKVVEAPEEEEDDDDDKK